MSEVKEITLAEYLEWKEKGKDFQLIDVREQHEFETAEMGGELIPLGTVLDNEDKISKDKPVVIHCRSGARSAQAVNALQSKYGFTNLYNLKGGILDWLSHNGKPGY